MQSILSRIAKIQTQLGLSGTKFALSVGIPQTTLSNMFNRDSAPKPDLLQKIVEVHSVNPAYLLTGEGPMFAGQEAGSAVAVGSSRRIPLLRQTVSCGPGQGWEDADVVEEYMEPLAAFPSFRNADVYAFRARGLSMVGVGIQDGDILFFDGRRQDLSDDLYVFALDGNVYCKLLKFDTIQKQVQIYSVQSHNLAEAELVHTIDTTEEGGMERLHIFGRVLAWIHENRVMWR